MQQVELSEHDINLLLSSIGVALAELEHQEQARRELERLQTKLMRYSNIELGGN